MKNDKQNNNYFKTWSASMAYILGFIMADGCLIHKDFCKSKSNTLVIAIHSKDRAILEFIHKEINVSSNIYDRIFVGNDGILRQESRLTISSKDIINDLIILGITPRKTGKEKFPDIPKDLIRDFIRGYFDGDGSIFQTIRHGTHNKNKFYYLSGCSFTCANKEFLEKIKEILNINKSNVLEQKSKHCYQISTRNKKKIVDIAEYFYYPNYPFALERKHKIFQEIILAKSGEIKCQ